EAPIAPISATKNGIQPNKPICTNDKPDSSCKYPGNQNRQKYQRGSLTKRISKTPHKLFLLHNCPQLKETLSSITALPVASAEIFSGGFLYTSNHKKAMISPAAPPTINTVCQL